MYNINAFAKKIMPDISSVCSLLVIGISAVHELYASESKVFARTDSLIKTFIAFECINPNLGAGSLLLFQAIKIIKTNNFKSKTNVEALEVTMSKEAPGLSDLCGLREAKRVIEDFLLFIKHPQRAECLGAQDCCPTNLVLYGPPGVGKTTIARALAKEVPNSVLLEINASRLQSKYVGESQEKISEIFTLAKSKTNLSKTARFLHAITLHHFFKPRRCFIFIDELEAVGDRSREGASSGSAVKSDILRTLFTELDGCKNQGIFVMGATNHIDKIDPALLRPGRLGTQVKCLPPQTNEERISILKTYTNRRVHKLSDTDFKLIAQKTDGYTGAALEQLVSSAACEAVRKEAMHLTCDHFDDLLLEQADGPDALDLS